jgi:hypothetical protein
MFTWLILFQSLSSFAFSSFGPVRLVFLPSLIFTPNWKAALNYHRNEVFRVFLKFIVVTVAELTDEKAECPSVTWLHNAGMQ